MNDVIEVIEEVETPKHRPLDPRSVGCIKCGLPSHRGLPPFISFTDIQGIRHYAHKACPGDPEEILEQIKVLNDRRLDADEVKRKLTRFRKPRLIGAPWRR